MNNDLGISIVIALGVSFIFFIVDIGPLSSTTWQKGQFTAVKLETKIFGITERNRYVVDFEQAGVHESGSGWFKWGTTREISMEFPKETWSEFISGKVYTTEDLAELKGQSLMGKAWEFIKKPRK